VSYPTTPAGHTCDSTKSLIQIVGQIPIVDFSPSNVCKGDATTLTPDFTLNPQAAVTDAGWNFGDGAANAIPISLITSAVTGHAGTTGTYGTPIHSYDSARNYTVMLTAKTDPGQGGCVATKTRTVSILRTLTGFDKANPYLMKGLDNEAGYWVVEDRRNNSTWEFAAPNKTTILSADKYWVTNKAGVYKSNDQSYVNSPCLDLHLYQKPAVSINYLYNADPKKDGAVLQYSLDGGSTWPVLGALNTGLEWYNEQNISSLPGNIPTGGNPPYNPSGFGWSGTDQTGWKVGKHNLNPVVNKPGNNKVRFRIAFSSDAKDTLDGFAFNDFRIEERNRITLVENFTNQTAPNFAANNTAYQNILSSESVKIEYHTAFPGDDAINDANPGDHDARSAFYGLTNGPNLIPRGYIDGNTQPAANNQADFSQPWSGNYLLLRSLVAAPVAITILNPPAAEASQLAVTVRVKGLANVTTGQPKLYVAIVEKQVGSLQFVMRKMLPTASGTSIPLPLAKNDSITITLDPWEVKNIALIDQLAIVAFVQDEQTRDVLQSAVKLVLDNAPSKTTGLLPLRPEQVSIFPNPADREILVELPSAVTQDTPVRLVDQMGHAVYNSEMKMGTNRKTIGIGDFSGGLYILQVGSDKTSLVRKKVVIVHEK
jgi:hypothetical protein